MNSFPSLNNILSQKNSSKSNALTDIMNNPRDNTIYSEKENWKSCENIAPLQNIFCSKQNKLT